MTMKVLGGRNLPDYWTRFDQLQRTAHKLRGTIGSPRGVFRFSSFKAFEEWKTHHQVNRPAPPDERTS
jgi:hypothetical protein